MERRSVWAHARVAALLFVGLAAAGVGGAACKDKSSETCKEGEAKCVDATAIMACQNGAMVRAPCGGPAGCSKTAGRVSCDDSISKEGDACLPVPKDNRACTPDKRQALQCRDGVFKVTQRCRSEAGCSIAGDAITCEQKVAERGDACPTPGALACALDYKSRLKCKDGAFTLDRFCRGGAGCKDADFSCDESIAEAGDPCETPGFVACAADGRHELVCTSGQFLAQRPCPKRGCVTKSNGIECD